MFRGNKSYEVRNQLRSLISQFYPQVDIRIVFKPIKTLGDFFKVKDVIPCNLKANYVYKYQCHLCDKFYIGKSTRHWHLRKCQHVGRSDRTGRYLTVKAFSNIRNHVEEEDHPFRDQNFSIVKSLNSNCLEIAESIMSVKLKPTIGDNELSTKLNVII